MWLMSSIFRFYVEFWTIYLKFEPQLHELLFFMFYDCGGSKKKKKLLQIFQVTPLGENKYSSAAAARLYLIL